jgi:hypothetical protein
MLSRRITGPDLAPWVAQAAIVPARGQQIEDPLQLCRQLICTWGISVVYRADDEVE